jgi:protein O-mannosyl-transferase
MSLSRSRIARIAILVVAVFIAYLPVLRWGGFIWDDPQYVTESPVLRTLPGLLAIWIHPLSTPQYYPIVHTTFWIEYHLVGLHPFLYHLDNVLLHIAAALLLWKVLARLKVPAPFLITVIFALHPVQAESVAWITERKNVLSTVFYLLALDAYLNFAGPDLRSPEGRLSTWFLSLALFVAALLSKSVTCSLPAVILLLVYWKHGNIRWRDIKPLIPFFMLGLLMAYYTGWLERQHVGASGQEWDFSPLERFVIAGRALWFYAIKLVWPHPLIFIYPRWNIHPLKQFWLLAFPASLLAVILSLWLLRRKITRGPLVAVLFFVGTLLPALGFINLFPMRYSFVADHFQYLASVGLIALFAGVISKFADRFTGLAGGVIVTALAIVTFLRGSVFQNPETLFADVVQKNPNSWMAWGNLGDAYAAYSNRPGNSAAEQARWRAEARRCYAQLYRLAPEQPMSHWKWGIVEEYEGDLASARGEFIRAIQLEPTFSFALDSLGRLELRMGHPEDGLADLRKALDVDPGFLRARLDYGDALTSSGDIDDAESQYQKAVEDRPFSADAQFRLANLLFFSKKRPDLALPHFAKAAADDPSRADVRVAYAAALLQSGNLTVAREQCRAALQIDPANPQAQKLWSVLGG